MKMYMYDLFITLSDGDTFEDGINAINEHEALEKAYDNWEDAVSIKIIK